ncbi:MAG: M48 family metallopeptidase [Candidatus Pacearchaeota archaeon]
MAERVSFYNQISKNKRKSIILITSVILIFVVFGYVIALALGETYFMIVMIISIIISVFYVWFGYYNSHKIAISSVGAKLADPQKYRQLHNIVESMALASGLPKPKVYIMPGNQINAFASGRDPKNAVIAVTEGALEKLNKDELEGVIAHEMSHIANYDIRFMTLTAILIGMIAIFSEIFLRSLFFSSLSGEKNRDGRTQLILIAIGIILAILAPLVTWLVQMAISRKREYIADATAVKLTRRPTGLINALKKIGHDSAHFKNHEVSKAIAPLFITNPFKTNLKNLTSTHPPLEDRIKVLERM